ncbi:hypothetical protein HYFRA_00013838 [Hymenoscyphus fraxineus]|uniref:Uncharacterized protein n=1 Tax=Hymenoscyphus fraxineus TaxID=746836 RepID=A0A9N9LBE6_9HELO|nr:hypothetical protein HYFRA_00013838 [Hymenoscyphus fraxineus]
MSTFPSTTNSTATISTSQTSSSHFSYANLPILVASMIKDYFKDAAAATPFLVRATMIDDYPIQPVIFPKGRYGLLGPLVNRNTSCIKYSTRYACGHYSIDRDIHSPVCVLATLENLWTAKCEGLHNVVRSEHSKTCQRCGGLDLNAPDDDSDDEDENNTEGYESREQSQDENENEDENDEMDAIEEDDSEEYYGDDLDEAEESDDVELDSVDDRAVHGS